MSGALDWLDWREDEARRETPPRVNAPRLDVTCMGDRGPVFFYSRGATTIAPYGGAWTSTEIKRCAYCGTSSLVDMHDTSADTRCRSCGAGLL